MDRSPLNDRNEYPDDAVLSGHLGRAKAAWDAFTARVASGFPGMSMEWRYYNDGKSWLCKVVFRKKTVCWISAWSGFFKVTFYFSDKIAKGIDGLDIDPALKQDFRSGDRTGKLMPLRVTIRTKKSLADVFRLVQCRG